MADESPFTWPAAGVMQVTLLSGGGCNLTFTFPDQGVVRSIGKGRIVKVQNIPTKRIARHYEITVRHEDDFESSYSIIDRTPHLRASESSALRTPGTFVDAGTELYEVRNGGVLHFQLFRAGRLVDPRTHIRTEFQGTIAGSGQSPDP